MATVSSGPLKESGSGCALYAISASAIGLFFAIVVVMAIFTGGSAVVAAAVCEPSDEGYTYTSDKGGEPSEEALSDIPANYLKEYRAAGDEYGLDWTIIAGIGKVETDHGRYGGSCATSSAGAQGPMQFMPSTWASAGVDGDGDGQKDVCNYRDAIPAAAGYLKDNGAPEDYHGAIYAYNHAEWYVEEVMAAADRYRKAEANEKDGGPGNDSDKVALAPSLMATASATTSGWDLVDSSSRIDYESSTAYTDALSAGVSSWNDLGSVKIARSPSPSETDVTIGDSSSLGGALGKTYSDGRILFNSSSMSSATANAANAAATHELGHALGMSHTTAPSVMNTTIITNSSENTSSPTSYDRRQYYELWGKPDPENSEEASKAGAVFPLPAEYEDDYSNDWGAARPGTTGSHEGTDIMAPKGTPIHSITDGRVVAVAGEDDGWNTFGGWSVMIEATESVGPVKKGDRLYYAHMNAKRSYPIGKEFSAGDKIGEVGDSGEGPRGTTGNMPEHLHLGWYDPTGARSQSPSNAMNPYPLLEWLAENGGEGEGGAAPRACNTGSGGGGGDSEPSGKLNGTTLGVPGGQILAQWGKSYPGYRYNGGEHRGTDVGADTSTPAYAWADGTVYDSCDGCDPEGYTNYTIMEYPAGGKSYYVLYGHVLAGSSLQKGKKVSTGDVVAKIGTSADAQNTPPHIHFAVWDSPDKIFQNFDDADPEVVYRKIARPTDQKGGNKDP